MASPARSTLIPWPKLTFQAESIATMRGEAEALLFVPHWQEIAEDKDELQIDVEWKVYEALEVAGKLISIAARCDSSLVGYFIATISPHPHYRRVVFANEDIHFLHPDYRMGFNGIKLIRAAVEESRKRGAKFMTTREKIAHSHAALWTRLGFRPIDTCYIMKL